MSSSWISPDPPNTYLEVRGVPRTSVLSFDFGPKNQAAIQSGYQAFSLTTTGTNTNIVKKTISDSTGALMGVSNKYIDIIQS